MDRWIQNLVAVCAMVAVPVVMGCGGSDAANDVGLQRDPVKKRVSADDEVSVLARQGNVTLVQTPDGATGFVPTDRVRIEPEGDGGGETGVMTAAADLDWQPPPQAQEESIPRSIAEINRERNQLNVLYLSADGSQEFIRPKLVGPFIDPASGQTCWPAYTCTSESCPGLKNETGRPVFAGVLNYLTVKPDGTYTLGNAEQQRGLDCPTCGAKEGLRRYVLPETIARLDELADEHRRRLDWERANR